MVSSTFATSDLVKPSTSHYQFHVVLNIESCEKVFLQVTTSSRMQLVLATTGVLKFLGGFYFFVENHETRFF